MSDTVLVALIVGATTVISAIIALTTALLTRRLSDLEIKVDGRLTQLLESTRAGAHAEGVTRGEQDQRDREVSP